MIKLIIGNKGSGKTKKLVDVVNETAEKSLGNVVCIEKGDTLTFSVTHKARLIDADALGISGYGEYYAMLVTLKNSNHDITNIFGDATLRIGSRDLNEFTAFLKRLSPIEDVDFTFTVSCDEKDIPAEAFKYAEKF